MPTVNGKNYDHVETQLVQIVHQHRFSNPGQSFRDAPFSGLDMKFIAKMIIEEIAKNPDKVANSVSKKMAQDIRDRSV